MAQSTERNSIFNVRNFIILSVVTAAVVGWYVAHPPMDGSISEIGNETDTPAAPADGTRERPYTMDKNVDDYNSPCPLTGGYHDWHHTSGWYLRSRFSEFFDPHMLICRACGATMIG